MSFLELHFGGKNGPFGFGRAPSASQKALLKSNGTLLRENKAQEMTPKLLALAKVCSVHGNIRDVSWHLSKHGNELEKRRTFYFLDKNGAHKNKACTKSNSDIVLLYNCTVHSPKSGVLRKLF